MVNISRSAQQDVNRPRSVMMLMNFSSQDARWRGNDGDDDAAQALHVEDRERCARRVPARGVASLGEPGFRAAETGDVDALTDR